MNFSARNYEHNFVKKATGKFAKWRRISNCNSVKRIPAAASGRALLFVIEIVD